MDAILDFGKTPVGFTGIFGMLFLVVLGMFPEKFSFGICFAPSESNALQLTGILTPSMEVQVVNHPPPSGARHGQ